MRRWAGREPFGAYLALKKRPPPPINFLTSQTPPGWHPPFCSDGTHRLGIHSNVLVGWGVGYFFRHALASLCASAICAGVILEATKSRFFTASASPDAALRLYHLWA